MGDSHDVDVIIVGAGILGVTIAYWLTSLYECTVAIADRAGSAAMHTSSRNTGVIHRPYYLDPRKKRVFARTSLLSHPMWESLAKASGLPWRRTGTFNIALEEEEVRVLEQYRRWGVENGMDESELELTDGRGVASREPEVRVKAGILSKTDVSVDFGAFTRHIWRLVLARGVKFLGRRRVVAAARKGGRTVVEFTGSEGKSTAGCRFLINAAGGGALEIANRFGYASRYAMLNFRGEYWVVDEPFASRISSNIYRPPKFPQYPFLDPHFVVRADGTRQIGPNAVVVPGPYVYSGVGLSRVLGFLGRPVQPKARLFTNRDFLMMVAGEWRSSLSKRAMCDRVRNFVPGLGAGMLNRRAVFGVRCSLVDRSGFVPEALLFRGEGSAHIVNFNSPGATGAPAYSALVVDELAKEGLLPKLKERNAQPGILGWGYESVVSRL
ncbi:MAG: FAD-dependent oxidoreductase [Nitrososphaerota archaeon]|nr:FAD-dependent oxidoreductase [Nitrososphaerota archaeon]